jgi:hypothetical protein
MKNLTLLLSLVFCIPVFAQDSDSPLVSFDDYESLMKTVKEHRKSHLIDLHTFNEMSPKDEVYILDTRSKEMYDRKHVKGAIHLNFSDFTQVNLDELFPNRNATILIYCNNNFYDNSLTDLLEFNLSELRVDENFASKVSTPDFSTIIEKPIIEAINPIKTDTIHTENQTEIEVEIDEVEEEKTIVIDESSITLALNIPTYINLYGYGYKNVYELSELVGTYDPRIQFEGSEVAPVEN